MKTRSLITAPALLLATLVPLSLPTSSYAAGETCEGQEATHVGAPGQELLYGTAERDVIVTGGARFVDAKAGDDLVCVTGPEVDNAQVRGGPGDDDVHGGPTRTRIELGPGRDRFVGGEGPDIVQTDDVFQGEVLEIDEPDVVSTGGGDDFVEAGKPGQPLVDDVDLGAGDDELGLYARVRGDGARFVGGPGSDDLAIGAGDYSDDPLNAARWVFTNSIADGTATADGQSVLVWDGFEEFSLAGAPFGALDFYGGAGDETLETPRNSTSVRMGAGDDSVRTQFSRLPAVLDGGTGRDHLRVGFCHGALGVDVAAGRYRCRNEYVDQRANLRGFESFLLEAREATVRGTRHADRLSVAACRTTVSGRGGPDVLDALDVRTYVPRYQCGRRTVLLLGGRGADLLRGGAGADVLLGGPGSDRADGRDGRDRCAAERRVRCER